MGSALLTAGLATACSGGGGGTGSNDPGASVGEVLFALLLRQDVNLGGAPIQEALMGDVNADGFSDVVQIDMSDDMVRVGYGMPDGTFTTMYLLDTPPDPVTVGLLDLSGDGQLDIALAAGRPMGLGSTAGTPTFTLAIWEQLAGGGFDTAPSAQVLLDDAPLNLCAVPGAGPTQDVILTFPTTAVLERFALTGPGVLEKVATLNSDTLGPDFPLSAVGVDAGGDGNVDLVVAEFTRVVLYPSDGQGGFDDPALLVPLASSPFVREARDFDGDGLEDLAIGELDAPSAILLTNAPGGFGAPVFVDLEDDCSSVVMDDFDGDGTIDLAATLYRQAAIEVRLASAPGVFGEARLYNTGTSPRNLSLVQLPGDTIVDLACTNAEDLSILRGIGDGSFRSSLGYEVGELPYFVFAEDFNGDGIQDAISVDVLQRAVVFLQGAGDGTLAKVGEVGLSPAADEIPSYLVVRDFDNDGRLDILSSVYASGEVQLLRNAGVLPFDAPDAADRVSVGLEPRGLGVGLIDGDGLEDVLVANSGDATLQLLRGQTGGGFIADAPIPVTRPPMAVLIADLDGNGTRDAVVTTDELTGYMAQVYAGDGMGGFTLEFEIPLLAPCYAMTSGDFDGDNLPEVVLGQTGEATDQVVLLRTQANFDVVAESIVTGPNPGTVLARDANQDGFEDLVVPLGIGSLVVLLGDGAGGFEALPNLPDGGLPIPQGTASVAFGDLDADDLPELLCVSPGNDYLWVARNISELVEITP